MYHSGSPLVDLVGAGLSVVITVFWIGVWHLHLISIMYGKWRLYRSAAYQIPSCHKPVRVKLTTTKDNPSVSSFPLSHGGNISVSSNDSFSSKCPDTALREKSDTTQASQTIIQVESATDESERTFTLFNGDLLPGVSILKPLVGVEQYLMQNLETFFLMSYPKFELLFCVMDESDPAIMVVNSLMKKYPTIDARLFIGGENVGVNPKINNMMPGYRASKYELVLVSDSGIMMREDTLLDMVYTMLKPDLDRDQREGRVQRLWKLIRNRGPTNGVGLVHQMPFSMDRDELGFPACLEKVYFGTAHARIYLSADWIGINCPTGMSALMRKSLLENKGGMGAFGKYLAEDYFFAKAMTDQGWIICISSQPAWQNSSMCDLAHFQGRLARWAKLRFAMVPLATLLEPFQECILLGILASFAISFLFGLSALGVFLVHVITWFLLDWTLLKIVQHGRFSYTKLDFIISWTFRETTCFMMFAKALLDSRIEWKSGFYRLKWGGMAEVIKAPPERETRLPAPVYYSDTTVPKSGLSDPAHQSVFRSINVPAEHYDLAVTEKAFLNSQMTSLLDNAPCSASTESNSPSKKSSIYRSRHIRSRSLPQKNTIFSFINNFSNRLSRSNQSNGSVRSTCDDLDTGKHTRSFQWKSDNYDLF